MSRAANDRLARRLTRLKITTLVVERIPPTAPWREQALHMLQAFGEAELRRLRLDHAEAPDPADLILGERLGRVARVLADTEAEAHDPSAPAPLAALISQAPALCRLLGGQERPDDEASADETDRLIEALLLPPPTARTTVSLDGAVAMWLRAPPWSSPSSFGSTRSLCGSRPAPGRTWPTRSRGA